MLIDSRVLCDLCMAYIGHVYGHAPDAWAADFKMAPEYAVCPDCQASAEQEEDGDLLTDSA